MADGHRLLTLVQISDLHLGVIEDPGLDATAKDSWQRFSFLDGFLGHDGNALIRTEAFVRGLRASEDAMIVVTGDLTSMGRDSEFVNARNFLTSGLSFGNTLPIGLACNDWQERTIPGNHDHWPGKGSRFPMLGRPSREFMNLFGARVPVADWTRVLKWPECQAGVSLRVVGIDSDADVWPWGTTRFLARGSFQSHLGAMRSGGRLPPIGDREIRVLLMHHSPSWPRTTLGLRTGSAAALEQFLGSEGFSLVLSGHTHEPNVTRLPLTYKGKALDVWEARCGTTTQRVDPPYSWSEGARRQRNRSPRWNSLIVHRFYGVGRTVVWQAQVFGLGRHGWSCCAIPPLAAPVDQKKVIWRAA